MAQRVTKEIVAEQGWRPGTSLENNVAFRLARWGFGPDVIAQQYPIGNTAPTSRTSLKASPSKRTAGGTAHPKARRKTPNATRSLRSQGWLVFRVDDRHGEHGLAEQLVRVCRYLNTEDDRRSEQFRTLASDNEDRNKKTNAKQRPRRGATPAEPTTNGGAVVASILHPERYG